MLEHDVFYNRVRSGYEELMSYYPNFWKEILEMRVNNRFAGYTLDRAAGDMEQAVLDQFFETCSQEMVLRYERFLEAENPGKELEERRRLLKIAWNGAGKLSAGRIVEAIRQFYGKKLDVVVLFTDRVEIRIQKLDSDLTIDRAIDVYLRRVMPANILYDVIYEAPMECGVYVAGVMTEAEILEIRQVF